METIHKNKDSSLLHGPRCAFIYFYTKHQYKTDSDALKIINDYMTQRHFAAFISAKLLKFRYQSDVSLRVQRRKHP
jgi:hypothetical protein